MVSLVVFGSVARDTERYDSDLDFLLVCEELPAGRLRRVEDFHAVEGALEPLLEGLKRDGYAISLSPVFKTRKEATAGSALFLDLLEDSIILCDREGFFTGVLARLRERLAVLGARRIWRGNAWYWDLKPDFKPGEVFEL